MKRSASAPGNQSSNAFSYCKNAMKCSYYYFFLRILNLLSFCAELVLTDTQDSSPQPSEEMLSSQSELRSSKCPQDRELPSIPPNNGLAGEEPPASGDSTYEVGGSSALEATRSSCWRRFHPHLLN